jgi:hypothetical protein
MVMSYLDRSLKWGKVLYVRILRTGMYYYEKIPRIVMNYDDFI